MSPPLSAADSLRLPAYAELHCRSNFSFLTGASHPEELVERAQTLGYAALALTDECSLAGVVRAHTEAQRTKFRLIIGTEMLLTAPPAAAKAGRGAPAAAPPGPRLVLLAQSRRGYGHLSHWVTLARRRAPKGEYQAFASDVEGKAPTAPMLAGLPDCIALENSSFTGALNTPPFLENTGGGESLHGFRRHDASP